MNSLAESTLKKMKELDEKHRAEIEREEELRELSRKKANEIKAQYEAEIREALLGPTLREEASEAQKRADRFDNERTTLWDVISPSNVFKSIRNDGENESGLTKQSLSAKTFGDWQRDKERLTQLKAEAEEKQQLSAAYAAQKRQERAEAMTLDELNQKINAPGAENDPAIGEYRKAYDRKKSIAETEKLPKKVLDLLDRYNAADTQATADAYASIMEAFSGQKSGKLYSARADKQSIGQTLESMGYSNYKDIAAYRKKITDDKNAEKQTEEWSRFSNKHPVAAAASARLISPTANIAGVVGVMKNKLSDSPLLTGNDKSADFALKQAQRTVDENISQGFKDSKYMTADTKAFLYQTGMSGIDSLGASLFKKAGGALLGGGAMTDAYLDAIEKGETGEQALKNGITAGVYETLFETISLGQLNALKEIAPKSLKDVVKNIAKSTFTNFTEEANTEIANIISDYLISGGLSDYVQQYQAYKDGGLSDGDAKKNTVVDLAKRVGEAGLGGALMGGAFGTVGSVAGKFNYEQALKQSGADVARNSGEERLLASAYELGSDANTALSGYAQSVEQNMKALEQSKKIFEESQSQANEGESTKKKGKKQEKAPEYTSKQLRAIGHLQEELAIQTDDTVKQKAESAVENRLSELGEEKGKIDKAKSAIVKSITGEKLTAKDKSNIKNSKYGQRVLNEFSDAARSYANAGYSSKWAAQLQGDIEGVYDSLAEPDIEAYRSRTTEGRPMQSTETFAAEKNADSVTDGIKMSSAATETMNKIMDEGQNADDYERSFKTYYQMGKSGYTLEEAMNSKGGAVSADFTDFQKRSAFELGQTALRTQKQVKLSTVSKIADNAVFALDENGNEVNLDDVDADGGQKMLFNRAALLRDVDAANTFISGYKPGVGLLQYSDSFRSFFNAGKQNSGKTFDSFLKENSGYKSLLSAVDKKTARSAFERGAAIVREAERKKAKVPAKKVRKKEGSFVNNTTGTELNEVYEAVSKKLGIDIEKAQSLWTADEREANAQFIAKEMKVLISADAESEFTDTVHELGHLGEVRNKSAMQKVRQAVLDWHNEVRGYNSTEDAISRFMQEYDCSRQDAIEEYTNEALAGLFSTDEGVKDFLSWLEEDSGYSKKEKKTVIQKIVELFDRLVESIRKIIAEGELSFAAKDFAQMQADRAAQIRKMFLDALDGAEIENADAEVKNSIKKTQNMAYDEQIEKIFSKKFNRSNSLYIGKPSESLLNAGFSSAPLAMNQSDIRKSHEATAKNKNYSRHGVSRAFFEQMPSKINKAAMFIMNKNGTTVITDYQMNDRNGERSFVALGVWHNQKMENDTVNQIKSVYPLDNIKSRIFKAAESGLLVITDKKAAQTMLATVGVQSSEVSRLFELSKDSISQSNNDVKYSLKQTDSEGTELSAENPDIRYSRKFVDKEREKSHNKKRLYNEADTLFMQWSNSPSVPVGERKIFKRGKEWVWFKKTEDGCVELFRGKNKKETQKYEQAHRKTDERIREIVGEIRSDMGRSGGHYNLHRLEGDVNGNGRQIGSKELQADTKGNSEHLRSGVREISDVTDSEEKKSRLRHSLGIADSAAKQSLVAQNKAFRRIISEQQRGLNRHFVDAQKLKTLARVIKQDYRSTIDAAELTAMLGEAYTGIANGKTISPDVVSTQMRAIAEKVVSASKNLTEPSERSKEIIKDIRSVAVNLSDKQRAEVAHHYGSYNDFRRSAFGALKIRNDGIELDSRYSELVKAYPEFFPADVAEPDQPMVLFEAVKALKNGYLDDNGFDYDSAVDYLAADLYEKYFEIPESKSLEDDYRLKLNAEKVRMRKELQTAKTETKEQFEEDLQRVREESLRYVLVVGLAYDEKFLQSKAMYERKVQKIADTNTRAAARKAIIRKVKRLSRILLKTSNKPGYVGEKNGEKFVIYNNIPEELRAPVASLCELFTDDNSVFEKDKLGDLKDAYGTIRANAPADETSFSGLYDEEVAEDLETLKKTIAGKRMAQLSAKELETVKKILDHFDAMIKNETEIFVNGRTQLVSNLGEQELSDLRAKGRKKLRQYGKAEKTVDTARKFGVNNYKPIYFFDKVGGVFKELFGDIRKGQDKYVRNIEPVKDVYQSKVKKFGVRDALRNNEAVSFTTERGEKLDLTLEQRMLIFATAKREQLSGQKSLHLMTGGVVFENQIQKSGEKTMPWKFREGDAGAHPLSLGDIMKIADSLTENEKGFVDEMVGYLSTDVAAWGNDVSMKLYGYRKFTEKYYIPFNSAKSFGYQRFGEQGESLLRSMSFTKQTVRGAASPLVLSDFTAVWARHIERMSAYNSMVIPLENLGRVFNYKTITDESSIGQSVASQLETALGKDYKDYIVQFVKDVNGNVMTDDREEGYSALLRKFKKSAVFASASVAIQQPSAIMRAYAVVDPKYFLASTFDSRKSYEECKKYAPVALLKEIGGFDTVSGRNMIDYILGDEYAAKEKPKAFFTDSDYRDEVLSYLPGKADEITWAHIWNAVKREQAAKTGLRGEQLLEKAGERFSEVIERTQVYDSVLTRSANMRSKSAAMQTITAFMAEPTTTINMLTDAWENRKTDRKKFVRVIASVTAATLLNSVLKSLVTAPRDDDEDKTYIEKYIAQVVSGFLGDMNPLSLLPIMKDIISLMQGYDVSRSDVDLFANFVKAIQRCSSDKVPVDKKITGVLGALADFTGIPLKNIFRDIYGTKTLVKDVSSGNRTTKNGIRFALEDEMLPILRAFKFVEPSSRQERLYEAWLDKDEKTYNRLASSYKSGTQVKNALKNSIKADYLDGLISAEQAEKLLEPLFTKENESYYEIRKWDSGEEDDESSTDDDEAFYNLGTARATKKAKEDSRKVENILSQYTDDEEEEEDEEAYAKFTYLEKAVKMGDMSAFRSEVNDLKKHGISDETIAKKVKSYLQKYDDAVYAAGEKYANGDVTALDSAASIAQKYGIEQLTVEAAIRSVASVGTGKKSIVTGTSAIMGDVHIAVGAGDAETSSRLIKEIVAGKMAEGKTEKEAYQAVRQSLNGKWRAIYLAASSSDRAEIRRNLYNTGAYASLYKLDETISKWIKNQSDETE